MPLEGWTTVDLYETADVTADMRDLPHSDESVDEINCSHALEHLTLADGGRALAEFHRVLRPGGTLTVEVPCFNCACRVWVEGVGTDRTRAYQAIYGEDAVGMHHLSGWSERGLQSRIVSAGFEEPSLIHVQSHGVQCIRAVAVRG